MFNGSLLKQRRIERKLSMEDMGTCLGTTGTVVWRWENGKSQPRVESIRKLSAYFGVKDDYWDISEVKSVTSLSEKALRAPSKFEITEKVNNLESLINDVTDHIKKLNDQINSLSDELETMKLIVDKSNSDNDTLKALTHLILKGGK